MASLAVVDALADVEASTDVDAPFRHRKRKSRRSSDEVDAQLIATCAPVGQTASNLELFSDDLADLRAFAIENAAALVGANECILAEREDMAPLVWIAWRVQTGALDVIVGAINSNKNVALNLSMMVGHCGNVEVLEDLFLPRDVSRIYKALDASWAPERSPSLINAAGRPDVFCRWADVLHYALLIAVERDDIPVIEFLLARVPEVVVRNRLVVNPLVVTTEMLMSTIERNRARAFKLLWPVFASANAGVSPTFVNDNAYLCWCSATTPDIFEAFIEVRVPGKHVDKIWTQLCDELMLEDASYFTERLLLLWHYGEFSDDPYDYQFRHDLRFHDDAARDMKSFLASIHGADWFA